MSCLVYHGVQFFSIAGVAENFDVSLYNFAFRSAERSLRVGWDVMEKNSAVWNIYACFTGKMSAETLQKLRRKIDFGQGE